MNNMDSRFRGNDRSCCFFFAMDQGLMSQNKNLAVRKPRLYIFLVASGFGLLGGIVGTLIGFLLTPIFLPPWQHLKLDTSGQSINEIVAVDFFIGPDYVPSRNNVILKDSDGNYFSFQEQNWNQIDSKTVDALKTPFNSLPCDWHIPPPPFYLRKIKDSVGVQLEHTLASDNRCYVLYSDGSLHLWSRFDNVFSMLSTNKYKSLVVAAVSYCAPEARKESAATYPTKLACLHLVLKQTSFDGLLFRRLLQFKCSALNLYPSIFVWRNTRVDIFEFNHWPATWWTDWRKHRN